MQFKVFAARNPSAYGLWVYGVSRASKKNRAAIRSTKKEQAPKLNGRFGHMAVAMSRDPSFGVSSESDPWNFEFILGP